MLLSSGTRIGPYEIVRPLGHGAGSYVYRARDTRLGREVALKLLGDGETLGEGTARQIDREARAAGALNHPNVLSILDVGSDDRQAYLVYELLEGRTLRARLAEGRLSLADAVGYALQIGRGLAAAHEKGIVHRDLKPENLFLTSDGRVKILDFGLAKLEEARSVDGARPPAGAVATRPGVLLGSIGYMAPEQIVGVPADARADLFSFGAIVHELVSGERAFEGSSEAAVLNAILTRQPAALSALVPGTPERLERLVRGCLRKDPRDRVQRAGDAVGELEAVAAALEVPRPQRRPRLGRAAAVAAAALAVFGAPLAIRQVRDRPGRPALPVAAEARTLAVLPFTDNDAGSEFFDEGLVELLTSRLSQVELLRPSLRVISARDLHKEGVTTAREAGRLFGATVAVSGMLRRSDGAVVATLTLVDANTALVLGSRDARVERDEQTELDVAILRVVAELLGKPLGEGALGAIAAERPAAREAYRLYLEGLGSLRRYDRAENVARAIELFHSSLAIDGRYALAHAGLAEALLRRYQDTRDLAWLSQARESGMRALELGDRAAETHLTLGLVEVNSGAPGRAIEQFQRALQLQPTNADALRELGNAFDAAGRTADAEATFRRALAQHPDSWAAYNELGIFSNAHGRLEEAAQAYLRVVALTPDNYRGYWSLGGVRLRQGLFDEARAMLERSIQLKPTAPAWSNLGSLLYYQGRYVEAVEPYRKATELSPKDDRLWGNLADALRWSGRRDESVRAYRTALALLDGALALDPSNPELLARRAVYRVGEGERRRALQELAPALRAGPDDPRVLYRAGLVYEQAGRRAQAIDALRRALAAGYPMEELRRAPPLASLLRDPAFEPSVKGARP